MGGYPANQDCVYDIRHPDPAGGRLSMRFNDLRLDTSDRIEVGGLVVTYSVTTIALLVSVDIR